MLLGSPVTGVMCSVREVINYSSSLQPNTRVGISAIIDDCEKPGEQGEEPRDQAESQL